MEEEKIEKREKRRERKERKGRRIAKGGNTDTDVKGEKLRRGKGRY